MDRSPSNLEGIVDRQIRLWLEERKVRSAHAKPSAPMPSITISRQYGAQGCVLGRILAERLDFTFWDQDIVHSISERSGIDEQMLDTVDEHTRNAMEVFIDGILRGKSYSEGEYLRQLMRLIHTVSTHGSAIFVGRGAQFILDADHALHVRIVSPFAKRVRDLSKRKQISERQAASEIERVGKDRISFVQHHYARDISDTSAYDIVVNVGTLSMESAIELIVFAYEQRFGVKLNAQ